MTLGPREASGRGADPERAAAEAVRRARAKIRRYGVASRLNRLASLTYAGEGCFDPVQLRQDVAAFFKALRPGLGGEALPYVWVPEWHPGAHGLHVHFTVGRYVRQSLIREAWGHGIVHVKLIGDLGAMRSSWVTTSVGTTLVRALLLPYPPIRLPSPRARAAGRTPPGRSCPATRRRGRRRRSSIPRTR